MYQNLAKVNNYLVSNKLGHSYSKVIHNLFGVNYELKELDHPRVDFDFGFLNVTIPYKKDYVSLCDKLSEDVKQIGACNLVVKRDGKLYAYNTDIDGIDYTFKVNKINLDGKKVLILGSGATSHTLRYYLSKFDTTVKVLSRNDGSYEKEDYYDYNIVVNCTPNSMYPNINFKNLVDLEKFTNLEFVFDLIYNPFMTPLLLKARKLNIKYSNGLKMLVYQAYSAYQYLDIKPERTVEEVISILERMKNIVLIGMPGSGKTTLAKELSLCYPKKQVLELDSLNRVDIKEDEKAFRAEEERIIREVSILNSKIISCGGGVILKEENMEYLRLNGIIFYLDFSLEELLARNITRPLVKTKEEYKKVYLRRKALYEKYADFKVRSVSDIVKNLGY